MANSSGANLIIAVRARAGRSNDTTLITSAFALDALNEAQLHIMRFMPRHIDMDKSDTSLTIATDDESIDISALDPAHIGGVWFLNGASTRRRGLKYMDLPEFRRQYILVSEQSEGEPTHYTRQANLLLLNRPVSSDFNGLTVQIDYTDKPTALADDGTESEYSDSDKGLRLFALAECFDAMALAAPRFEAKALKTRALFNAWFVDYMDYYTVMFEELYDVSISGLNTGDYHG